MFGLFEMKTWTFHHNDSAFCFGIRLKRKHTRFFAAAAPSWE